MHAAACPHEITVLHVRHALHAHADTCNCRTLRQVLKGHATMDALLHRFERQLPLMHSLSQCMSVIFPKFLRQTTIMWNPHNTAD